MNVVNIRISLNELDILLSLLRKEIDETKNTLYLSELERLRIKLEETGRAFELES